MNAKVQALRDSALMLVQDWCDPRARQTPQQLQQHTSSSEATGQGFAWRFLSIALPDTLYAANPQNLGMASLLQPLVTLHQQ